ncbi:hypothetical protein [Microbulbifer sp. HZ11]|uniref:hypothetical protein n=1 Tax=Microbulbifer sp. HZ11 TaxID=1453501 RepID=UPI000AE2FFFC|nr:hypothetical protein [Microbulbifer sp. HZ11]
MSIGQQIYFAIELFAPELVHRERFCRRMTRVLTDFGSAPLVARQIATVLADALPSQCADYHLEMAHLITFHPPLSALLDTDQQAARAMHFYMTYFLDITALPSGQEMRYAVN